MYLVLRFKVKNFQSTKSLCSPTFTKYTLIEQSVGGWGKISSLYEHLSDKKQK